MLKKAVFQKFFFLLVLLCTTIPFYSQSDSSSENLVSGDSYTVTKPVSTSLWYVCKTKGKSKAGKILRGPFESKESAIACWYYLGSTKNTCISENLKYVSLNPKNDFPVEFKEIQKELEENHSEALKKYNIPVNVNLEKKYLKRNNRIKEDSKIYEIDLADIKSAALFENKLTADFTCVFEYIPKKNHTLNVDDVIVLKWKGKSDIYIPQINLNFLNKTVILQLDVKANEIFDGYKAFKLTEPLKEKTLITLFYSGDLDYGARIKLIKRSDKINVSARDFEDTTDSNQFENTKEAEPEPEQDETADEPVEEAAEPEEDDSQVFEFVPDNSTTEELNRYRQEYLSDYAVDDVYVLPEDNQNKNQKIANPDVFDENGRTDLMKASASGNDWQIKNLLDSGARINLQDKDGWTALMYAARYCNNLSTLQLLLDANADVKLENSFNSSALLLAVNYNNNPDIIGKLLDYYSSSDQEVIKAFVQLLSSTFPSDYILEAKVKLFIEKSIPINTFFNGKTPLMYAAEFSNSTKIIKLLLDNNAMKTIRSSQAKTAFDYAKENTKLKHDEVYWSLNSN